MSMPRKLSFFLRLQIKQMNDGALICQSKYYNEVLKKFKMDTSKEGTILLPHVIYIEMNLTRK